MDDSDKKNIIPQKGSIITFKEQDGIFTGVVTMKNDYFRYCVVKVDGRLKVTTYDNIMR